MIDDFGCRLEEVSASLLHRKKGKRTIVVKAMSDDVNDGLRLCAMCERERETNSIYLDCCV